MFRVITIEREYGCGGGAIAAQLAKQINWSLWDKRITEEIAKLANVDASAVRRCPVPAVYNISKYIVRQRLPHFSPRNSSR